MQRGGPQGGSPWWVAFGWLALVVGTLSTGVLISYNVSVYNDTDAYLNNAQTAGNPKDTLRWLKEYRSNLEKRGMTRGYISVVHSADADMAEHTRKIDNLIEEVERIQSMPAVSQDYLLGMTFIQNTIRDIPNPASGWVWNHGGYWLLGIWLVFFLPWIFNFLIKTG